MGKYAGDKMTETKKVYVLLMRSNSLPSVLIRFLTRAGYTHASLGFSEDCMQLYSFARKYEHLPLPGCFTSERIDRGFMGKDPKTPCALYYIDVPVSVFDNLQESVMKMYNRRKEYKYNYLGLFLCWFGIAKRRKNKYFCSEFVAQSLTESGAISIEKPPSLFRPVDFQKISRLNLVYEGNIGGLRNKILINSN
jgi:hypothetical protein